MASPIHYSSSPEASPTTTPPSRRRAAGSPTKLDPPLRPESVRLSYGMGPSIADNGGDSPTMHTKAYKRRRESELFEQRRVQAEQEQAMEERRVQSSPSKRLQRQQQLQYAAKRIRSLDNPMEGMTHNSSSDRVGSAADSGKNAAAETRLAELEGKFLEQGQRIQVLERQLLQVARIVNKLTQALESKKGSPEQLQQPQPRHQPLPETKQTNSMESSSCVDSNLSTSTTVSGHHTSNTEIVIYNEEEEQETDIENSEPSKPSRRPLTNLDVAALYPDEDKDSE
ncbi:hypothetical protein D0Z03_002044 [Geotrichum reessii]|nr:hypothetical protein D0Z03_002044 [Galactomyces reessii]